MHSATGEEGPGPPAREPRPAALALVAALGFFLASLASELVAHQAGGLTVLWPANALLLGLVLTRGQRRADRAALIAGAWFGSLAAAAVRHQPPLLCAVFPLANLLEALLAAAVLHRLGGHAIAFDRMRAVLALLVACAAAPLLSATAGALALQATGASGFAPAWFAWYGAAAISLALVTPAVVVAIRLADGLRDRPVAARRVGEVIVTLAPVALVSAAVFASAAPLFLFAVQPFILLATFRLRQAGAVAAVAIVAAIAVYATSTASGPIAAAALDHAHQFLFLQLFLAVSFLSALPVAAALAERDLRAHEAHVLADHFKSVVENAAEVIFRTDLAGRITYLNPAWETVSGRSIEAGLGEPLFGWVDADEQAKLAEWAAPVFTGQVRTTRRMLRLRTAAGALRWTELAIQALCDEEAAVIGATGTLRDVDDRKRLEDHVLTAKRRAEERARAATMLAATDELTGLANRRAFLGHLERHAESARDLGLRLTVAIFDVDHFKRVNDRFGHAVGDRVLQLVAARAKAVCRAGDLVGRLGGEEFGILMPSATAEDAASLAERLRQAIEAPWREAGEQERLPTVTVSIGVASQDGGESAAALLAGADAALYAAKEAGRNRVQVAA